MKTMSRESMDKVVSDHFMYEATDNIEGVLRTFVDDAEHEVVGGPDGTVRGKHAIRRFYERLFSDLKGERVEPVMRLYGDDFLIDETIWIGHVVDGRPFRLDGKSGKARLRLLHIFKLRDGLIAKENLWFHFDDLKRQIS
ncbi:MAG: nuclear transport factor 2 family protein [Microcystaceae cyanobacterium]